MSGGIDVPGTDGRWKEYQNEGRAYYYDTVAKRTTWRDPRRPNPRAFVNAFSRAWSTAHAGDSGAGSDESSQGSRRKVTPLPLHELKYAPGPAGGEGGSLEGVETAQGTLGSKQRGVAGLNRLQVLQSISNDTSGVTGELDSWREQQTAALINSVAARHGLPPPPKDRSNMVVVNGEFCTSSM